MRKIFNLDALVKVEIMDKKQCTYFTYQPYKKYWFWEQKEMFYMMFNDCYTPDYLREKGIEGIKFIVEGDKVFYRPEVTLTFAGKASVSKSFDTYQQALEWGKEQADKNISTQLVFN